jgi:hypothetical protein
MTIFHISGGSVAGKDEALFGVEGDIAIELIAKMIV